MLFAHYGIALLRSSRADGRLLKVTFNRILTQPISAQFGLKQMSRGRFLVSQDAAEITYPQSTSKPFFPVNAFLYVLPLLPRMDAGDPPESARLPRSFAPGNPHLSKGRSSLEIVLRELSCQPEDPAP
jgi:hypothetical protein